MLTMTSSEERREVAELMRGPFDVYEDVGRTYITGNIFGMQVCARDEPKLRNGMRYLADLIYPARGDEAGWSDVLTVEALEYIYALESAIVYMLSAEEERQKVVSFMCEVRDQFAPNLSKTLYDWTKDVVVDD